MLSSVSRFQGLFTGLLLELLENSVSCWKLSGEHHAWKTIVADMTHLICPCRGVGQQQSTDHCVLQVYAVGSF